MKDKIVVLEMWNRNVKVYFLLASSEKLHGIVSVHLISGVFLWKTPK